MVLVEIVFGIGDDITLQLRIADGVIQDAGFIGSGCAISQASASLMIDLVKGRKVTDAKRLIGLYFQMIKGKITPQELEEKYDQRVTSRIIGEYAPLVLQGNDIRYIKRKKND